MLNCVQIYFIQFHHIRKIMTTYAEYAEEIAKSQSLAEAARKDEINVAIQEIKALTGSHGATFRDFFTRGKAASTKAKGFVSAQLKTPETDKTWTGRGHAPRWFNGKKKSSIALEPSWNDVKKWPAAPSVHRSVSNFRP